MPRIVFILPFMIVASAVLRGVVVDHVVVVDPATNHLGWFIWSIAITTLRWQWWAAVLIRVRTSSHHLASILLPVVILDVWLTSTSGWTYLVYGDDLDATAHEVLFRLGQVGDVVEGMVLAVLAMAVARRPRLIMVAIPLSASATFFDGLPSPGSPFLNEVVTMIYRCGYIMVLAGGILHLEARTSRRWGMTTAPGTSSNTSCH